MVAFFLPLSAESHSPDTTPVPLILLTPEDWTASLAQKRAPRWVSVAQAQDFQAMPGQIVLATEPSGAVRTVIVGVGANPAATLMGTLALRLPPGQYTLRKWPKALRQTDLALYWALGQYRYTSFKAAPDARARLVVEDPQALHMASALAQAIMLVRDLVNAPPNIMGPDGLEAAARALASQIGAEIACVRGADLLSANLPLIHAVGKAAAEAPRLVELEFGPADGPRLAIVGKGVTFDSGGLDIKPSAGMRLMKKDMGGAAHALGLAQLIHALRLPLRVHVLLPIVENAIGAGAFRPGDIYRARNGLSVEIDNTDAEGRLILADALTKACEHAPDLVLDFATLTGAARVALGSEIVPFFTRNDKLAAELSQASEASGDPVWRLPLWTPYLADLDSPVADMKNAGDGMAGAITAALFMERFVQPSGGASSPDKAPSWCHFDIYAWNPSDKPGRPKGGEAQTLRALIQVLARRYPAPASQQG